MLSEKKALYKAIHSLNEKMREVVYMRLSGEFNFVEIGEIMGESEAWARTTFYRAKQKIMEVL
jgi:RNA polymerase sigma-70 factor (ECF subfamily)